MKTNQSVQILGLVLCTASAVHAQPAPSSGGPLPAVPPSTQATPPPPPPSAAPTYTAAPPSAAPLPALPSSGPAYVDYAQPVAYRPPGYAGRFMLGLNWDVSLPVGSVHDFTSNVTPVGFQILGEYWVTSQIAVGAALDWQTFWDTRPRSTYQVENGAITATADNSVQSGAARAIFRYYFQDEGRVLPYAGAHIGIGWQTFQSAAADLAFYDNTLSVLLGGELGAAFVASRNSPLFTIAARYTYLPTADFLSVTNVQTVDFLLGVLMQ